MICPSAAQDNGMARRTVNVDQRFSGGSCETTGQHALVPGAYERGTAFHNQHQSIRDIAGHTYEGWSASVYLVVAAESSLYLLKWTEVRRPIVRRPHFFGRIFAVIVFTISDAKSTKYCDK